MLKVYCIIYDRFLYQTYINNIILTYFNTAPFLFLKPKHAYMQ